MDGQRWILHIREGSIIMASICVVKDYMQILGNEFSTGKLLKGDL